MKTDLMYLYPKLTTPELLKTMSIAKIIGRCLYPLIVMNLVNANQADPTAKMPEFWGEGRNPYSKNNLKLYLYDWECFSIKVRYNEKPPVSESKDRNGKARYDSTPDYSELVRMTISFGNYPGNVQRRRFEPSGGMGQFYCETRFIRIEAIDDIIQLVCDVINTAILKGPKETSATYTENTEEEKPLVMMTPGFFNNFEEIHFDGMDGVYVTYKKAEETQQTRFVFPAVPIPMSR